MPNPISNLSPEAGVAVGIIVGLLSTCVQSIGLTLQRKSHMLEDEKATATALPQRPPYRRRRWQIGMLLFLLANIIGSTIQITTLPLPLLSTLQASGLVFNSILATLLLKEPWTWKTGIGTVLVAGGAVLISFFSAVPEPSHSLRQLVLLLRERSFLVWFIMSLVFVVAILIMDFAMRKCVAQRRKGAARLLLVRGMSYGMVSGILSAHALLLAKSAVELIVRSLADHNNQFASYQSWLLILAFLVLALSQLYYLHLGLKLISTSILYPFVFCIYNIVAILDGLIYFRQMDRLPPLHAGLIALGTVILLSGVLALSWRFNDEPDRHTPLAQAEIPQTLLVPGSGFVADPEDDDTNESNTVSDYESEEDLRDERARLLSKPRARSKTTTSETGPASLVAKRRKRAHTLREVTEIWNQTDTPEGSVGPAYGTFMPHGTDDNLSRVAERTIQRKRSHSHVVSIAPSDLEANADESAAGPPGQGLLRRASTMPYPHRSGSSKRRRRRKSGHEGGALFSDMLRKDWWRSRRGKPDDDDDDHGVGGHGGSESTDGPAAPH